MVDITASIEAVGVSLKTLEDAKTAEAARQTAEAARVEAETEREKHSIDIVFKYNGVAVDVLDYDTLAASTKHKFEVCVYKNGEPYEVGSISVAEYSIDGKFVDDTFSAAIRSSHSLMYLRDNAAYIEASAFDNDENGGGLLAMRSCAIIHYNSNVQTLTDRVNELEKKLDAINEESNK